MKIRIHTVTNLKKKHWFWFQNNKNFVKFKEFISLISSCYLYYSLYFFTPLLRSMYENYSDLKFSKCCKKKTC